MKKINAVIILTVLVLGCSPQPVDREIISSPNAPAAVGSFSQAVRVGDHLYLSGQLGIDPSTGRFVEGGFVAQARQVLENQIENEEGVDEKMKGWDPEHVAARDQKARERREARKDILLQSLLTLTREARVVSRRVDTLVDTDAPTAADLPDFFD